MKLNKSKKYLISYLALFAIIACFFYSFYFLQGKAFVNLKGDGYRQCYRAVIYYKKYLKEIVNNIFVSHSFIVPQWDFTLGEGSDIIQTLNYYIVGDPFALLCVVIPRDYLYLYADISAIARLFFAGLVFGYLCFYLKKENWIAVLIGSLSYAFCFYGIMNAIDFPFMTNYLVYMPLIILGIEKIIRENKYLLLIISVFMSATSSLPFFYIIVILTTIYCIIRAIYIEISIKEKAVICIKIIVCSLLGVFLASPIFIPALLKLLGNSRITKSYSIAKIFNISSLIKIIPNIVIGNHTISTNIGGVTIPCLFTMIYMFCKPSKNNRVNICLFIFMVIALCSPLFSQFMRGMKVGTPSWIGICALIVNYIFVCNYDNLVNSGERIIYYLFIIIYFAFSIYLDSERVKIHLLMCILSIISLIVLSRFKSIKFKNYYFLGVTLICITLNIYNLLSPTLWDYTNKATEISSLKKDADMEIVASNSIEDNTFYRYSGNELECNESSGSYVPSTNYYWSFPNDDVVNFRTNLGYYDYNLNHYDNYNDRSQLYSLASVKYYLAKDISTVPYGFEYYKTNNDYDIYVNRNYLPLFYVYTNTINYNDWKDFTILKKQDSLLNGVILENCKTTTNNEFFDSKISFNCSADENISISSNEIVVKNTKSSIDLSIDYDGPGEYYLIINEMDYINNGATSTQIYVNGTNDVSNTIYFKTKDHYRYAGRNNYAVCLGYLEDEIENVNISFLNDGKFTFKSIEMYKLDVEKSQDRIELLRDIEIRELDVKTNNIHSDIFVDEDKFLCISIPYTKGWKAYLDGNEIQLQKANVMYMGFNVTKGEHTIELEYRTPGFKLGIVLSFATMTFIVLYYVLKKKSKIHI